jgi:hypothetical protein
MPGFNIRQGKKVLLETFWAEKKRAEKQFFWATHLERGQK